MKLLFLTVLIPVAVSFSEPHCSKFHYEEKLLEKMIRTEILVEDMKKEMDVIQKMVKESLEQLKEERRSWTTKIEQIREDGETQLTTLQEKARIELEKNEKIVESMKVESVGFTVKTPDTTSGDGNNPLKFKTVIYNTGNGYDKSTGVFTCQQPGLYYFSATVLRSPGVAECFCYFYVNDTNHLVVYSGAHTERDFKSGSGSFVSKLNSGDRVYLSGCYNRGNIHSYSSFSGFRISD